MSRRTNATEPEATASLTIREVHVGEVIEVPPHVANELTAFDRDPGLCETYTLLLSEVPPRTQDDAAARILRAIVNAENPEQVNAIWESTSLLQRLDTPLLIRQIGTLPADFGKLGAYLGIDATDETTGEELFVTSGAANVLGALIKAHIADWLPCRMVFRGEKCGPNDQYTVVVPRFIKTRVGR